MSPFDECVKANPVVRLPRFMVVALQAWRGITFRRWAWTTAITLLLLLTYAVGVLVPILGIVPNLAGPPSSGRIVWEVLVGMTAVFLSADVDAPSLHF